MTTDPHTAVDRIPLTRSVHYVARGLPEVPNQYGPGVLAPSEITLTYRAAPDSQLGRVHAYVTGRIWVDGKELPLLPGGLYGQHYMDGLDNWPAWLAEEARLHDPERTAPAGLGVSATPSHTDRGAVSATLWATAEHHTVAEWICCDPINPDHALCAQGGAALRMLQALLVDDPEAWKPAPLLDEVMRLLPPAGSVAESHRLAMSQALDLGTGAPWDAIHERVQDLRRLADEAQQQPAHSCGNCEGIDPASCLTNPDRARDETALKRAHVALAEQAGRDQAALARVHEWVTSDVVTARSEFGDGYREAQRDIRDLLDGRRLSDEAQQQECTASISGSCLREAESETACDTDAGECVHGGRPGADAQQEPPVHGESVAHLAGLHDDEPAVDARQDGAQQ